MSGVGENIDRVNSTVRTLISLVVVGLLGAAGWLGYEYYQRGERELQEHKATIAHQQQEIGQLNQTVQAQAVAMRLLKKDHRLAHIHVLQQWEQNGQPFTKFRWVEINDDNQAITHPREFIVEGTVIKVDGWIVKFRDQFVESGDALRGTSICLFRRLHGEYPRPDNVHILDAEGHVPGAYRERRRLAVRAKNLVRLLATGHQHRKGQRPRDTCRAWRGGLPAGRSRQALQGNPPRIRWADIRARRQHVANLHSTSRRAHVQQPCPLADTSLGPNPAATTPNRRSKPRRFRRAFGSELA